MRFREFVSEDDDNVVKGDFSKKGGPKFQKQNAEKISLAQAFGSSGYNLLRHAGITLNEKPAYWSDLESKPLGDVVFAKIKKLFKANDLDLPVYDAWEVFPIDPDSRNSYLKHPLVDIENMPLKGVFVLKGVPYKDAPGDSLRTGNFLVDSQGANSYIRFWRKI